MTQAKQRSYESVVAKFSTPESRLRARRVALIAACKMADLNRVQELLEQHGTDDQEGLSDALHAAAENGHSPIVECLHRNGADIHAYGGAALRIAAQNGHLPVVEYLHRNGADIHAQRSAALQFAAGQGHLPVVEYLHRSGADIHANSSAPLQLAAGSGYLPIVEYLHNNGADIHERRSNVYGIHANHSAALRIAAQRGRLPVVEYLHRNGVDIKAMKSLDLAAVISHGNYAVVEYLQRNGADIRTDNDWALQYAAQYGQLSVVEYLHRNGVDIHADGDKALWAAVKCGHLPVVEYLHRNGANIQAIGTMSNFKDNLLPILDYYVRHGGQLMSEAASYHLQNWRSWNERHGICPDGLRQLSPFFFRDKTFASVAAMLQEEDYGGSVRNTYAYHTAGLFGTEDRVLNYLERWGTAGKQPLHDIIQSIQLPQKGRFNITAWGDAVLKHGPKMARLVKFAGDLPEPIRDSKGQWSYQLTREAVALKAYENGGAHPPLATLCFSFNWSGDQFNTALAVIKKYRQASNGNVKPNEHIPAIEIDGAQFGKPAHRFYKLPPGDPRGLLLGEFTNCCQHLSGAGAACAKHGYLSPHGGFYVVADKAQDEIVAQSWAWRGKKGELVLDSLESLAGHMQPAQWKSLCDEFAKKAGAPVNIGIGGATPDLDYPHAQKSAKPLDYDDYRDSKQQYRVIPR